jgi:hypothetical protein
MFTKGFTRLLFIKVLEDNTALTNLKEFRIFPDDLKKTLPVGAR